MNISKSKSCSVSVRSCTSLSVDKFRRKEKPLKSSTDACTNSSARAVWHNKQRPNKDQYLFTVTTVETPHLFTIALQSENSVVSNRGKKNYIAFIGLAPGKPSRTCCLNKVKVSYKIML